MFRPINLTADVVTLGLVDEGGLPLNSLPVFVRGEEVLLQFHFVTATPGAETPLVDYAIDDDADIHVASKPKLTFGGDLLAHADEWNQDDGADPTPVLDWSAQDEDHGKISIRVGWASAAVAALLGDSLDSVDVLCQVDVFDSGTRPLTLCRFTARLYNDAYRGTEGSVQTAVGLSNARISGGFWQFWNDVSGKWHTMFPTGAEGAVTTAWGVGED